MKTRTYQMLASIGVSFITFTPHISFAQPMAQLDNWQFNPKTQQLEINLSAIAKPEYFYLAQPPRLVLNLPNTKLGKVLTQQEYGGVVQKIRISQLNANITRIVLDLLPGTQIQPKQIQLQPISRQNPTRWVFKPHISPATASYLLTPVHTLPPAINLINNTDQPLITVPPLNHQNPAVTQNSPLLPNIPIIEFGQPLPMQKF
ncbi:MAG: AMIN domain-containing protein [Cuspidothrix sp.]